MNTKDVISVIKGNFNTNHLAVCSVGRTAEEVFSQIPNNQVLFVDCLGSVSGIAMGLAMGLCDVWVDAFDTDGSFMYNLSILHSISDKKRDLKNLTIYIFDNKLYESCGGIKSRSANLDWNKMCCAWNIKPVIVDEIEQLRAFLKNRQNFLLPQVVILNISNLGLDNSCQKDIDGLESKYRFKRYINNNIKKGILKPCAKN